MSEQYFDVLGRKIERYSIQPQNVYTMDEKGTLIGYLIKSRRVFTEASFESHKLVDTIRAPRKKNDKKM
jgi:hypothetical protein